MYWTILLSLPVLILLAPLVSRRARCFGPPTVWAVLAGLSLGVMLLFGLFSGRLTHSAIRHVPRHIGQFHRTYALQQGNVPELVTDPDELEKIRSGPVAVHEYDPLVSRKYYFSDEDHPQTIFGDLSLHKGDYVEITVSGQPIQWKRDDPDGPYTHAGPEGNGDVQQIRDKTLIPKFALPTGTRICVFGQLGRKVRYDNVGVPWVEGKHPDPWAIGVGPVVVRVPENGAKLYAAPNLLWMPGSWEYVTHTTWHVTVKVYR